MVWTNLESIKKEMDETNGSEIQTESSRSGLRIEKPRWKHAMNQGLVYSNGVVRTESQQTLTVHRSLVFLPVITYPSDTILCFSEQQSVVKHISPVHMVCLLHVIFSQSDIAGFIDRIVKVFKNAYQFIKEQLESFNK